jgi:hypothetical protein
VGIARGVLSMKSTTIMPTSESVHYSYNKDSNRSPHLLLIISKIIEFVLKRRVHEDLVLPYCSGSNIEGKFTTKIPDTDILISLEDFITYGFTRSLGEFQGQLADYRYMLPDKRSVHLRVFPDHFRLHWDYIDPRADPIGHIAVDAPHWFDMANNAITTITRMLQMLQQSSR